jgi:hypothetical protein
MSNPPLQVLNPSSVESHFHRKHSAISLSVDLSMPNSNSSRPRNPTHKKKKEHRSKTTNLAESHWKMPTSVQNSRYEIQKLAEKSSENTITGQKKTPASVENSPKKPTAVENSL